MKQLVKLGGIQKREKKDGVTLSKKATGKTALPDLRLSLYMLKPRRENVPQVYIVLQESKPETYEVGCL